MAEEIDIDDVDEAALDAAWERLRQEEEAKKQQGEGARKEDEEE